MSKTFKMPEPVAYIVRGFYNGKVIGQGAHFDLDEAKQQAAVFAMHYPLVHTEGLFTSEQVKEILEQCILRCSQISALCQEISGDLYSSTANDANRCVHEIRKIKEMVK